MLYWLTKYTQTRNCMSALQEYLHFDVMTDDAIIILLALEHTIWFILA